MSDTAGLSRDDFLGGRLKIWQPKEGFRSGVDAVLLAGAVPANTGDRVLELGCGAGVASLCLAWRVPGLELHGVEIQPVYADLARRNAAAAGMALQVTEADLTALPLALRQISFDHVLMNPPYFLRDHGSAAPDSGRDMARGGATALGDWIDVATRRLAPNGVLSLIQRAERVPDILAAMDDRLGAVELLPILPRAGQSARLCLIRARKGRKSPFQLRAPVIMHNGARHGDAGDGYAKEIENVLKNGQLLEGFAG